jgi:hypothetical protein
MFNYPLRWVQIVIGWQSSSYEVNLSFRINYLFCDMFFINIGDTDRR